MRRRAHFAVVIGSAVVSVVSVGAGACSVPLDFSLLNHDASTSDVGASGPDGSGGGPDGNGGGGGPDGSGGGDSAGNADGATNADSGIPKEAGPDASVIQTCAADGDCTAPNACYVGHCDLVSKSCVYNLCPQVTTCTAAICDPTAHTCGSPASYHFRTVNFGVPGVSLGCSLDAPSCFTAAYPFIFIGTTTGVQSFMVSDITSTAPPPVTIQGLTFAPAHIITSGRTIWFLGAVQGGAAPYSLKVASLDVPSDPTIRTLVANSATLSYPMSDAVGFPAPNNGLFVVFQDAARKYPIVTLREPVKDGAEIDLAPPVATTTYTMFTTSDAPAPFVAASAGRLLTFLTDRTFSFEANVGTANATNGAAGTADLQPAASWSLYGNNFVSGPDGSVLWSAIYEPCSSCGHEAHVGWVISDAQATAATTTQNIVIEAFAAHIPLAGPVAWLDTKRVLGLATISPPTVGTSVQVVARDTGLVANRRLVLPQAIGTDHLAASGSNAFGYVLTSDVSGNNMSVSIFDPNCQ